MTMNLGLSVAKEVILGENFVTDIIEDQSQLKTMQNIWERNKIIEKILPKESCAKVKSIADGGNYWKPEEVEELFGTIQEKLKQSNEPKAREIYEEHKKELDKILEIAEYAKKNNLGKIRITIEVESLGKKHILITATKSVSISRDFLRAIIWDNYGVIKNIISKDLFSQFELIFNTSVSIIPPKLKFFWAAEEVEELFGTIQEKLKQSNEPKAREIYEEHKKELDKILEIAEFAKKNNLKIDMSIG